MLTVLGILIATTYASVGLLALWAGVSRWHWFLRTAVVAAALSPLLFVPAYEPFIALAIEAVVVAFGARLAAGRRQSTSNATIGNRSGRFRPRYSVASLLWLIVVVAFLAALWTRLPEGTLTSWLNIVLLGVAGALAVLVGAWLVRGRWRLWWRVPIVVAVLAAVTVGLTYCDSFIPDLLNAITAMGLLAVDESRLGMFGYPDPLRWIWCWIVLLTCGLVAGWFSFAVLAGWLQGKEGAVQQSEFRKRGTRRRWISFPVAMLRFGLIVAILIPPFGVMYQLLTPTPIPTVRMPEPNAFDDFLAAGKMMSESTTLMAGDEATPIETLDAESKQYQAAFDRLRLGLSRPYCLPLTYTVDLMLDEMQLFRNLSRALAAEGTVAESRGQIDDAARSYVDCIRLGEKAGRGRLIAERFTGIAIERTGCRRLSRLRDQLTVEQCRHTIDTLRTLDEEREPLSDIFFRERIFQQHALGWIGRLLLILEDIAAVGPAIQPAFEDAENRQLAINRLLLTDFAIRAYRLDHETLPGSLRDLVPGYLPEVPLDPYSDEPFVYRKMGDRFLLYSVYSDGEDNNGEPPSKDEFGIYIWFEGRGDLTLDHRFAD